MYQLLVWLHLLAAMAWIGGAVFLVTVLAPVLRSPALRDQAGELLRATGGRLKALGWVCIITLVSSGTALLEYRGVRLADLANPAFYQSAHGQSIGLKLLLVTTIVSLSLWHDFFVGPRARDLMVAAPRSPEAASARRQAGWLGRITLVLGLAVVLLAVFIVRGRPF